MRAIKVLVDRARVASSEISLIPLIVDSCNRVRKESSS